MLPTIQSDPVFAAAVGGLLLLLTVGLLLALRKIGRLQRELASLVGDSGSGQNSVLRALKETAAAAEGASATSQALKQRLTLTPRHLGLVRFNAFDPMGGGLSFSLALLDDQGTGMVLTSLTGSEGSRVYAKSLCQGQPDRPLSSEERQAVSIARRSASGEGMPAQRAN